MNSNTIKAMYGCASSPPSSSSNPAASSKPEGGYNVPNPGGARGEVWQRYDQHRATTSYQANSSIQDNLQQEWLSMPSLPERGRASNRRPQDSSPFTQKSRSSSPRKVIGKRSTSIAEMGERLTSSKRIRQEGPENAHIIPMIPPVPAPSSSGANSAAVTGGVAVTVHPPSDAGAYTSCLFDGSVIEWDFWLTEDPDAPATSDYDSRHTEDRTSNHNVDDMNAFLETWWNGVQKAKESLHASGDRKTTNKCDPLSEDREHAVPATAWFPWSALYNEGARPNQGFEDEEVERREDAVPAGAMEAGNVPYGGNVVARDAFCGEENTRFEFPPPDLATPGVANNTMMSQSPTTRMLALPLATPEVLPSASQLTDSGTAGRLPSSEAHTTPVGPWLTESDISSPRTTGEPSTTGATPNGAFRYSAEAEAEIWALTLHPRYPAAYRLFHSSECAKVIEGQDVTRYVRQNHNKVTKAAGDKGKLWVCQATAKWSNDGTVSYLAEPCGVANTSASIFAKHIATQHLGKVLKPYGKKETVDAEPPGE